MAKKDSQKVVKSLSVANMKKEDSRFSKTRKVDVHGYTLNIDEHFRPTKIQEMLMEISVKLAEADELGIVIDEATFVGFQMVKHFTDIEGIPDDIGEQLIVLKIMLDNDFLVPILNEFDAKEIQKAQELVSRVIEQNQKLLDEIQAEYDRLDAESKEEDGEVGKSHIDW